MNRRDICEIFETDVGVDDGPVDSDEADCIRLSYIANSTDGVLSALVGRYRSAHSEDVARFLVETIAMVVNNPRMAARPCSPFVLVPLVLNSLGNAYLDVISCLERLSEVEGMAEKVLVPMIYGVSLRCSQLRAESTEAHVSALEALVGFPAVLEELRNERYWGICDDAGTPGFPVHAGFACGFPCFLDGFFEPFIYEKSVLTSPVKECVGMCMKKVAEMSRRAYQVLNAHSYRMHGVLHSMISRSKDVRTNFMRYVCRVVSVSKERIKTVFNWRECISDGFAFNLCALMSRFNRRIVEGCMMDRINAEDVESLSLTSFPTFCYFSKVHLLLVSCVRFGEYIRELTYEYRYIEDGGERAQTYRKGLESKANVLKGLLFMTDFVADEKGFLDFMAEYTAETEYPWPDFYYQTLLWMQLATVDALPSAEISGAMNRVMEDIMDWRTSVFKKDVVRILSCRSSSVRFTMINRVVDYYNSLAKADSRMDIRNTIHRILRDGKVFSRMNVCKRNITFINCMMKDFEFGLSEGLSAIKDIREDQRMLEELERTLKSGGEEAADAEERMQSLRKNMNMSKHKANGSFLYADGCFDLFMHILEEKPDLFLVDEMIQNFVRVLNCNLKVIIGPQCTDLVIQSPQQYGFDPKNLLRRMVMIYISICSDRFVEAVAGDRMYFDIGFFHRALEICESKYLISESQLRDLRRLVGRLGRVVVVERDEAVPDEFLDPLTRTAMRNPVILLTSKVTVDRSTYDMLMMNGGIDPFNRIPLTESMVVEDAGLKRRIDEFHRGSG